MEHFLLMAGKTAVLLLGSTIAAITFLARRRTGSPLMVRLGVGFTFIATGSFLEGLLFEVLGWELLTAHLIESAFVFAGLVILAVLLRPRTVRR